MVGRSGESGRGGRVVHSMVVGGGVVHSMVVGGGVVHSMVAV